MRGKGEGGLNYTFPFRLRKRGGSEEFLEEGIFKKKKGERDRTMFFARKKEDAGAIAHPSGEKGLKKKGPALRVRLACCPGREREENSAHEGRRRAAPVFNWGGGGRSECVYDVFARRKEQ